ncbi:hypothetical protein FA13DRAFT_1810551 [Coprinellus micaceus]|uniref:Uncharacterized protein n=1 Tax=Coprinellus micaceus TaxID=71717 RepID=A0A4Y7TPQ4_COPMI|nr:hypothetical protein FA13DRAFT_1810551 [Coprinellus micaceus]
MSYYFRIQPDGIPDLRQHMRNCILPPLGYQENDPILPPKGHVSHRNHLSVRPETYRRFETIHGLHDSIWFALENCLDSLVPATSIGVARRLSNIRHSSPPYFHSALNPRPEYIQGLTPWLEKFPFATVKRILHLSLPETKSWSFQPGSPDDPEPDSHLFATYTWAMNLGRVTRSRERERRGLNEKRMLVAVQPPWILTERDLHAFADSRTFPPFMYPGDEFPECLDEAKDRLWAKVWDSCAREKIHYFVLTSYTHWVFGVFSPGYSTAWTSQVIPFDSKVPSIVEMLSYWAISAMGIDGGYVPPPASEPFYKFPAKVHPPRLPHQCIDPEDSDSSWGGSTIDSEDSAEICPSLWSFSQGECIYETKMYDPQKKGSNPAIEDWLRTTLAEGSRSKAEIETSDWFVDPMDTIPYVIQVFREPRSRGEEADLVGSWLY